jgi:hypothetical protein
MNNVALRQLSYFVAVADEFAFREGGGTLERKTVFEPATLTFAKQRVEVSVQIRCAGVLEMRFRPASIH